MYDNHSLCAKCGGLCCKNFPGCVMPSKDNPEQQARELLATGNYTVDWWEGDPRKEYSCPCTCCPDEMKCDSEECNAWRSGYLDRAYYIRPRMQNEQGTLNRGWGGSPCVFLTESGCKLSSDQRPDECQLLEPREGDCIMHDGASKRGCCVAWIETGVDLYSIAQEYNRRAGW